jgi:hypothetical protein
MEERRRDPDITDQVEAFMAPLPQYPGQPTRAILDAIEYLQQEGPAARRPVWGEVVLLPDYPAEYEVFGHRLHEVRPLSTDIRILGLWSPDRVLVLLFAGDKAGDWKRWYRTAIPEAAQLYRDLAKEMGWE